MASMTIENLVPEAEVLVVARGPIGPGAELRLFPLDTPTHIQWRQEDGTWTDLIALSALIGPDGPVGVTWQGEWNSSTEYVERDVVFWEDKLWFATADNTNVEPADLTVWDVLLDGSGAAEDREQAEAAAEKAQKWAEEDEDVEVEPGSYSALHHSAKASAQRGLAQTAKTDAETARDKAQAWAEEDEDVEVETGMYSAKHWAMKAEDSAGAGASTITFTPAGNLEATNVRDALYELDDEKAAVGHTHDIEDVTGLDAALGDKADTATTYTKTEVDVIASGLDTRLDAIENYTWSTVSPSGTSAIDILNLDTDHILLHGTGLSHGDGTSRHLEVYFSTNNGGAWTLLGNWTQSAMTAANAGDGSINFVGLKSGYLWAMGKLMQNGAGTPLVVLNSLFNGWANVGAQINAIRIQWATGVAFDGGTLSIGVKV